MNKYLQIFGLATALSVTSVASAQAQMSNNNYKIATQAEMTIPDHRGHVVVSPNASRVVACTSDKRMVLTYVFASAHYQTVGNPNKPLPVGEYLDGLVTAFKNSAKTIHSSQFNPRDPVFGMAYPIQQAMSDYTKDFNRPRGTFFDWMFKIYHITPHQSPVCK